MSTAYAGAGYLRWRLSRLEVSAERYAVEAELCRDVCDRLLIPRRKRDQAVRDAAQGARAAADLTAECATALDWAGALEAAKAAKRYALRARAGVGHTG